MYRLSSNCFILETGIIVTDALPVYVITIGNEGLYYTRRYIHIQELSFHARVTELIINRHESIHYNVSFSFAACGIEHN